MVSQILNMQIYGFLLVFLRMGSAIMVMPGFNTSYLYPRGRLTIALAVSLVLVPFLSGAGRLPDMPADYLEMLKICLFEVVYGIFLGTFMQVLYAALTLVGNFAGQAIGLAAAQAFDPATQNQSIVVEAFLSVVALTLIFLMDFHHLMLGAVADSYAVFPVGGALPLGDFSEFLRSTLNDSFAVGLRIAAPFIAFTIVFYTGMGLVSRLMPQLNIFFLSMPLQLYLGSSLLLIMVSSLVLWFLKYYEDGLDKFLSS